MSFKLLIVLNLLFKLISFFSFFFKTISYQRFRIAKFGGEKTVSGIFDLKLIKFNFVLFILLLAAHKALCIHCYFLFRFINKYTSVGSQYRGDASVLASTGHFKVLTRISTKLNCRYKFPVRICTGQFRYWIGTGTGGTITKIVPVLNSTDSFFIFLCWNLGGKQTCIKTANK